jgi:PIN domain nuclease of toxin-antitoxin system
MALTDPPSALVCATAVDMHWTRDPFDRLISAHALAAKAPLVTKDRTIRAHLPLAWWATD